MKNLTPALLKKLQYFIFPVIACFSQGVSYSQTAAELLEDGIVVDNQDYLFLAITEKGIQYDIKSRLHQNFNLYQWNPLEDDLTFLFRSQRRQLNVVLLPVNPLKYTYKTDQTFIVNRVDSTAAAATLSIINTFKNYASPDITKNALKAIAGIEGEEGCQAFDNLVKLASEIEELLKQDQKERIKNTFVSLDNLDFREKEPTENTFNNILEQHIKPIQTHFDNEKKLIDSLQKLTTAYDLKKPCTDPYIARFVFSSQVEKYNAKRNAQLVRLTNLRAAATLVEKEIAKARSSRTGMQWAVDLPEITFKKDSVSLYQTQIFDPGVDISQDNEVTFSKEKQVFSRVQNLRKFKRFIPEVSTGIAYTFITFPKFGTTTDASGKQRISNAGEETVRRINFSTAVNWNYYTGSSVNPFIQIGAGANVGYPTLFTGLGLRFGKILKVPAFSFSFGLASTWIKTLEGKSEGDEISGTAELEKITKYEFNWPPKPYLGFQFQL